MREKAANQTTAGNVARADHQEILHVDWLSFTSPRTQMILAKSPFSVALIVTPNFYLHLRIKYSG